MKCILGQRLVDHTKLFQKFSQFFFKTGRFPGKMEMAVLRGITPTFVKSNQLILSISMRNFNLLIHMD